MKATDVLMERKEDGPKATDELTGVGSAALTKKLRVEYSEYNTMTQAQGEDPKPWEEWLQPDYALDKRGLAYPVK